MNVREPSGNDLVTPIAGAGRRVRLFLLTMLAAMPRSCTICARRSARSGSSAR